MGRRAEVNGRRWIGRREWVKKRVEADGAGGGVREQRAGSGAVRSAVEPAGCEPSQERRAWGGVSARPKAGRVGASAAGGSRRGGGAARR
jgi:hypothetical protein